MESRKSVEAYIAVAPKEVRPRLREIRAAIREAAPNAVESISYGMPFYSFKGETGFDARLCYFCLLKTSVAFYMRLMALEGHSDEVSDYQTAKSALRFPPNRPIPVSLIKKLVRNEIRIHAAGKDDPHAVAKNRR